MSWASRRWGLKGGNTPIYRSGALAVNPTNFSGKEENRPAAKTASATSDCDHLNWKFHVRKRELLSHPEIAALQIRRHQRDEGKSTGSADGCRRSRDGESGWRHTADCRR